jgi:Dolichyl-phosphate-mannose-protein mannosyltransferase
MAAKRNTKRYLWLLVFCVALVPRLVGLRYGLPAVYNPDEVAIMSRALAFAKGDLNPHNFLYPTFYFYALFAWEGLTAALAVAVRAVDSFGAFQREFFMDPTRVFVAGRLLTALLGAATVVATGVLGSRLSPRLVGPVAALILAVSPLHVLNSHYVKHDVPVTFLIVLAYLAYDRLWRSPGEGGSPRSGSLVIAAATTGVAFATHYYAIFLAIPLAWSAAHGARDARDAIRRIAIAAIVSGAVFFLLSPFILVEPAIALRDIRANRQIVVDRAAEQLGYAASALRYGRLLVFDTIGFPAALLALVGIGVTVRRAPARALWLLAFPLPFLLFIASTYPASRYLVAISPFAALFAAIAIAELWRPSTRVNAGPLLLAAAVVTAGLETYRVVMFIRHTDTRTLALDFVRAHVPDGATILTQPYSVPLEPTASSLREAVSRSGQPMPTKTGLQLAREPYPAPAYRMVYIGRGLDVDKLYLPAEELSGNDPLAAARREHVAFVVLKRYNDRAPATMPFLAALAREGRRLAVFSPYSSTDRGSGPPQAEPFLHNTDTRITVALERPGPVVEIWQIDGSGS